MSDLVVARNCCMARILPGEAELVSTVSEWTGLPREGQKVYSTLSGPTDWILRYIKTTFTFIVPYYGHFRETFEGTHACMHAYINMGVQLPFPEYFGFYTCN